MTDQPMSTPDEVAAFLAGHGLTPVAGQVRAAARRARPAVFDNDPPAGRNPKRGRLYIDPGQGVLVDLTFDPPTVDVSSALRAGECAVVGAHRLACQKSCTPAEPGAVPVTEHRNEP